MIAVEYLFSFVFELAVLGTAIPLCAWGAVRSLRAKNSSFRFQIWILALFGLLLFPIAERMLPRWKVPAIGTMPIVLDDLAKDFSERLDIRNDKPVPALDPSPYRDASIRTFFNFKIVVVSSWILGLFVSLYKIFVSFRHAETLRRNALADRVGEAWRRQTETVAGKSGISVPKIAVHESIDVPMVVGIFSPTILLPENHLEWSESESRSVLLHEISHLRRNDPFWLLFSRLVFALYWFHPFVRSILERLRAERESACDDAVVLHGEDPQDYAEFLLKIALGTSSRPDAIPIGLGIAMSENSPVEQRIDAVLDAEKPRNFLSSRNVRLSFVLLLAILAVAALLSPFASYAFPCRKTYTAEGMIQMITNHPILNDLQSTRYDRDFNSFIATQFAIIRSPLVIEPALEKQSIFQLSLIRKQDDPMTWIAKKLKLKQLGNSELISISFSSEDPIASQNVVNGIIDSFLEFHRDQQTGRSAQTIKTLSLEIERNQIAVEKLRKEIESGRQRNFDTTFQENQLKKIQDVLDALYQRNIVLQTELNAPGSAQLKKKASLPTEAD